MQKSRSGARLDSFPTSDTQERSSCNEKIESKVTNDIIESKQSQGLDSGSVCSRSGVSGDSLSTSEKTRAKLLQ